MAISHGPNSNHLFLYLPTQLAKHNQVWVDELDGVNKQENLASLAMVVIKQHGEEL